MATRNGLQMLAEAIDEVGRAMEWNDADRCPCADGLEDDATPGDVAPHDHPHAREELGAPGTCDDAISCAHCAGEDREPEPEWLTEMRASNDAAAARMTREGRS